MRHSAALAVGIAIASAVGGAGGAEVTFSAGPEVARRGDGATIRFTLARPTDVEVAVLDAEGNVVRHLAAGLLGGGSAPPAPLKTGLAQELVWDGKDDFGRPAAGGGKAGLKVRVRAGIGVKLGRFIGESPYVFGGLCSIAADEAGNLYLMGFSGNRNQHMRTIRVFDGQGRYLRTLMPFPADLPPSAMKDVAAWDDQAKAFRPRNLNSLNPEFYGGKLTIVSASASGGLILSDGLSVSRLDARGGVPGETFTVANLWGKQRNPNTGSGPVCLAASPDGRYLYLGGPWSSKTRYGHTFIDRFPPGRIYRMELGGGTMQPFATIPVAHTDGVDGAWTKANKYRNDGVPEGPIHGLAVDGKGNVYVCDQENQRLLVLDSGSKEIGSIKVECPHQVAVHPATGEVYVLSRYCAGYWRYKVWVSKFRGFVGDQAAAPAAIYELPQQKTALPAMALVAAGKQTTVYLSGVAGGLVALADRGAALEPADTSFAAPTEALDVFNRMEIDPVREEVYVSDGGNLYARFDGRSGQGGLLKKDGRPFLATDLAVGYDGLLYAQTGEGFSGPLERLKRDLAPAPYEATGTHVLSGYIYGRYGIGNCEKGIGVGPDGMVYVAWMFGGWVKYAVSAWGPDGKPINGRGSEIDPGHHRKGTSPGLAKAVIGPIPQCNGGVRVDLGGNIYVGMITAPPSRRPVPEAFEKNEAYRHCTGVVVKFPPEGGTVHCAPDAMTGSGVDGALATYQGLAPFSHPHLGTTCCVCRVPRFAVDRFGRLALPNATGNYVQIVDNAGNELLTFGRYGNFDSQYVNPNTADGKVGKPTVDGPDLPLAWPNCAALSDTSIYVLDIYNRRVVRADLTWKAEGTAEIK